MNALIAVQVAFCFLVLFVAGLFVATFDRLSNQSTGFSAERILTLDTVTNRAQSPLSWDHVVEHLRTVPGVESVSLSGWAPLTRSNSWNAFISVSGAPPSETLTYYLGVAPGWMDVMRIRMIDGRDFRASDTSPAVAIVNETFAKEFFDGQNPVGRYFERPIRNVRYQTRIIGFVRDARYRSMREPMLPVIYVPFRSTDASGALIASGRATFMVRTSGPDPLALASILRREVTRAQPGFRVTNIRTQLEINQSHTIRERLLAMLALFFATVVLVLAGVGLYGVLNYSVLQRRHEIGIRMAIGAQPGSIARLVTVEAFVMVLTGAAAGIVLGMASSRYVESLVYQVKTTDLNMLVVPSAALTAAAVLAALPAVIHAVRVDPIQTLRAE